MNTKKIIIAVIVLALVIAASVGTTLAYFTAQDRAHNYIVSGSVKIEVQEWADEEKTVSFPEEGIDGAMPGDHITKIVEVTNKGSGDAWVRIKVDKTIELAEGTEGTPDTSLVELDIDTEHWTEEDGWYYYNAALEAGETTAPLFTSVTFDADMGNTYQNCTVSVDIAAQAVQTANNGSTALEAAGWPEEQG